MHTAWVPPQGMSLPVARSWREFFRKALTGTAGYVATPGMYIVLYKAQLGRCYICQTAKGINPEDPKGKGSQRLGWDHNHATGIVRGLLCCKGEWSCNRIVGRFRDNPVVWARGFRYLTSPPALVLAQVRKSAPGLTDDEAIRVVSSILNVGDRVAEREDVEQFWLSRRP
jgi:hypothetical protein